MIAIKILKLKHFGWKQPNNKKIMLTDICRKQKYEKFWKMAQFTLALGSKTLAMATANYFPQNNSFSMMVIGNSDKWMDMELNSFILLIKCLKILISHNCGRIENTGSLTMENLRTLNSMEMAYLIFKMIHVFMVNFLMDNQMG